ncbi:3-deoxy-D-manno-octulosonic acid kinase [Shewanella sp. Scap07]|uniref:3-deoxy-D-manno-octulosonic acid kinase n=1 Tax=Shewanella sp. Scap07 TaxID=2589987 RepID=UPI0015BC789E|nr:3-deoxy-D-manno-octulosonic acid kinase [Shewanella sp. Scap07]QLE87523.1 3-deoxy-D-manno-octulosonic acid kinase [Shewanella sp. Scap07]
MQIKTIEKSVIAYCQDTPSCISPLWFTAAFWHQHSAVTGSSTGRYTTWFVDPTVIDVQSNANWVLRHYYRGGLMEKLSRDAYLYTGLTRTRAVAELALLEQLYQEGFNVPKPIAAQITRQGLHYRGDIIIERVSGAKDLVAYLTETAMTTPQWRALGELIATFHQRGVYHADLNAKNILISGDKFYLIDFDRGCIKSPHSSWQQANIKRLLRSFNKEKLKQPTLDFDMAQWQALLDGYNHVSSQK